MGVTGRWFEFPAMPHTSSVDHTVAELRPAPTRTRHARSARRAGVGTRRQRQWRLHTGRWESPYSGVYRVGGRPQLAERAARRLSGRERRRPRIARPRLLWDLPGAHRNQVELITDRWGARAARSDWSCTSRSCSRTATRKPSTAYRPRRSSERSSTCARSSRRHGRHRDRPGSQPRRARSTTRAARRRPRRRLATTRSLRSGEVPPW